MLSVYMWNIYIDSLLTEAPAPEFLNKILNRFRLRLLIFSQLLGIFNLKKWKVIGFQFICVYQRS